MNQSSASKDPEALQTLAGEYVLGTLAADEQAEVVQRLAHDPALQAAVDAWEQRLLPLAEHAAPQPPSPRLWSRIERSLGHQQQVPRTPWWQRLALWQGASAAGLAASLLLAVLLLTQQAPAPRYLVVLVAPGDNAAGWVVQASDARNIELIPLGQDQVPEGMVLQFWTKGEQWRAPVSLGLVKPAQQYRVPQQDLPPLEPNQLFELTLEKAGGSPTGRPTGPVKFIGRALKVI